MFVRMVSWTSFRKILGPFWGLCLSLFGPFLNNFGVMLGLGGPSWGPLASFGAILGSTSDFDAIFEQIRGKQESILGTILDYVAWVDAF